MFANGYEDFLYVEVFFGVLLLIYSGSIVIGACSKPAPVQRAVSLPVADYHDNEPCHYRYPECTRHEPPMADEIELEVARPCGGFEPHLEDLTDKLGEVLDAGQVYETIATSEGLRRTDESGNYCMAWIRSYASEKCCGINQLVAFDKRPPGQFVFSLNGKIIEVYGDALRSSG